MPRIKYFSLTIKNLCISLGRSNFNSILCWGKDHGLCRPSPWRVNSSERHHLEINAKLILNHQLVFTSTSSAFPQELDATLTLSLPEHKMVEVARGLWRSSCPSLCLSRVSYSRLPKTMSRWLPISPRTETPQVSRVCLPCPDAGHHWNVPGFVYFQTFIYSGEILPNLLISWINSPSSLSLSS